LDHAVLGRFQPLGARHNITTGLACQHLAVADSAAVAQVVAIGDGVEGTNTGNGTGFRLARWQSDGVAVLNDVAGLNQFLLHEEPEALDLVDTHLFGVTGNTVDETVEELFTTIILCADEGVFEDGAEVTGDTLNGTQQLVEVGTGNPQCFPTLGDGLLVGIELLGQLDVGGVFLLDARQRLFQNLLLLVGLLLEALFTLAVLLGLGNAVLFYVVQQFLQRACGLLGIDL